MTIRKIVVIGPESTGKSTLSEALAAVLKTAWVPEFARSYLEALNRLYTEADLLHIAEGQIASEEAMALRAEQLLICDTDLYVIKVWSEHSYQRCHRKILEQIAHRRYDLYLLTGIDLPWQDDPLREHPEAEMRNYFYRQYRDLVMNSGTPWAAVNGSPEERLEQALQAIRQLMNNH